ncbi:MAG: transcriptional repressor [Bacteroidetes bacterium]|nr:transcriptional repressor [Bacteroidota bacterium]
MDKIYNYSSLEIKDKISAYNLKCTSQRLSIYDMLLTLDHPTVEDIYEAIKTDNPSISLSTVYNTLESFVVHDLIWKIKIPNGKMRYDARKEQHCHLYDRESTKLIDYFDDELMSIINNHLIKKNIKIKGTNGVHLLINQ